MKKGILVLAVAALLLMACSAYAVSTATATIQLYGWYTQFCAPIIPFDPNPRDCLSETGVFGGWLAGLSAGEWAAWNDPVTQNTVTFPNDWDFFPNILMGDGYIAWTAANQGEIGQTWSYDGVDISDTDAWISLPGQTGQNGGWHYVGIPYPVGTTISYIDVVVTDGTDSYTMLDMWGEGAPNWINLSWYGDDPVTQNTVSVPDDTLDLQGGKMYQIWTNKNNLALILPHPAL